MTIAPTDPRFPGLQGEMAERTAMFPWQEHPLGPYATWPQPLRNALQLMLECKLPMYIAWGPELYQFYNDAYRPILGDKHPGALGRSARDTWAEIWPTIGPMWDQVLAGRPIGFDDYKLTIRRYGFAEDCYFNFSYSPLRDDQGAVAGVLVTFVETTKKVLNERRLQFLDELSQTTRALSTAVEVMRTTSEMLGAYMGVSRCAYAHVHDDQDSFDLIGDYNHDVPSIVGTYQFSDFGAHVRDLMLANEPYVNNDVATDPATRGTDLSAYRLTQIQAVICVPLHKNGKFVAAMAVHQSKPRTWTEEEIKLVRTVVDRCWESLERIRAMNDKARLLDSERAARQEAEKANAFKDTFLATLSHELRTPLTAITGWVHLMRKKLGQEHPDLLKGVEVIDRSARAQSRLIEDLLDMSRVSAGKLRLDKKQVTPAGFVQAAYDLILPKAQAAGLSTSIQLQETGPVLGDADRLQQVVWNLLSNAVKFTPKGGHIAVEVRGRGSNVEITVSDNGVGINGEFLPHLFERFRQADGSITRKYGGLGLGLSIVQHLVALHGGTVTAHSPGMGQGATFRVVLPLHQDYQGESSSPAQQPSSIAPMDLSGKTILVVDDDSDTRELAQRLIEEHGAIVCAVGDADSAMHHIRQAIPDLVCSDIGMPGKDGYEFVRWLRSLPPEHGGCIPAVAMTAFARAEDQERSLASGFDRHLSKPLNPASLVLAIGQLLSQDTGR